MRQNSALRTPIGVDSSPERGNSGGTTLVRTAAHSSFLDVTASLLGDPQASGRRAPTLEEREATKYGPQVNADDRRKIRVERYKQIGVGDTMIVPTERFARMAACWFRDNGMRVTYEGLEGRANGAYRVTRTA